MPYVFDPRRWERSDQVAMVLGILLGAGIGGGLGHFWIPPIGAPEFVVRHSMLVLAAVGAIIGWIVTYLQGFTSNDVPPDYP